MLRAMRQRMLQCLLALALSLAGMGPVAAQAPSPACDRHLPISVGGTTWLAPYCANQPLTVTNAAVERAIVAIHGLNGSATAYLDNALEALRNSGLPPEKVLIVAPQFWTEAQYASNVPPKVLFWRYPFWGAPSDSTPKNPRPQRISSFTVLDELLLQIGQRGCFPNLKQIVVSGHSAGGQMTQHYAVSSPITGKPGWPSRLRVRYVPMNPGNYLYVTDVRPIPGQPGRFAVPDARQHPGFNNYGLGLANLYPYHAGQPLADLRRQYANREVIYLVGGMDNNPQDPNLTKTPAATLQGRHRLERATNYFNYLVHTYGPAIRERHRLEVVPGVGHYGRAMMNSPAGLTALFQ